MHVSLLMSVGARKGRAAKRIAIALGLEFLAEILHKKTPLAFFVGLIIHEKNIIPTALLFHSLH